MTDWEAREAARFESGEYRPVLWAAEAWWRESDESRAHFAHVSNDDPGQLAYTPDARKGAQDRQTRTRPGRYLTRYFGKILSADAIRDIATDWAAKLGEATPFKLARTPDDIEDVYRRGPRSCMAGEMAWATRPYGAGDLAIAYLERDGSITARVLCWPDRGIFAPRFYGDAKRLRSALPSTWTEGEDSEWSGARLLRIEARDGIVLPYLDVSSGVDDMGSHLVLGGSLEAGTNGIIPTNTCDDCGDGMGPDSSFPVGDSTVCEHCYCDHYFLCEKCGESYHDEACRTVDEGLWCEDCAREHATSCYHCGNLRTDTEDIDGLDYCEACEPAGCADCEDCERRTAEPIHVRRGAADRAQRLLALAVSGGLSESEHKELAAEAEKLTLCEDCAADKAHNCAGCDTPWSEPIRGGLCEDCEPGTAGYQEHLEAQGQGVFDFPG